MSTGRTLRWLGFRQARKGAVIVGLLSAFMIVLQGTAYPATYPDQASQQQFAASLKSAPALGLLYGDSDELNYGATGYVAYRVGSFMSFVVAIWALMTVTKLLRGNEEDGRWEVVRAGATRAGTATVQVAAGFFLAYLLAFGISLAATLALGAVPAVKTAPDTALLINLVIFAPGILFAGIGVLVSQLAATRRRALLYGLTPLAAAYVARGIGNTDPGREWLLHWTPFGWNQLIHPVTSSQPWWLAAFAAAATLLLAAGWWLARRDLGSSTIHESDTAAPRYYLLGGAGRWALRQNFWVFAAWGLSAFAMTAIIANIITIAAEATASSPALSQSVYALSQTTADLKIAFLGAGLVFIVMVLMIMATTIVGGIRGDEAKQYLDNILVHPRRRTTWLMTRLALGVVVVAVVAMVCGLIIVAVGSSQHLALEFWKVMALAAAMTGTIVFLLGLGTLAYGLWPRLAVSMMYLVITWSFLIDLVSSAAKLDEWFIKSSLFHYISFNLADWPDWQTFGWLIGLGLAMAALGVVGFARRDIVIE